MSTLEHITADHLPDSRAEDPMGAGPGLVLVLDAGEAACKFACFGGGPLVLGRGLEEGLAIADMGVSRNHARLSVEGGRLRVMDLGSRNGTFVDGERVVSVALDPWPRVVRVGNSLLVPVRDMTPFTRMPLSVLGDRVVGPRLALALMEIERAGRGGDSVLITGESGTGKEMAARRYHQATGRRGPFLAVNCATIPPGLAERLLFGAKRGAYSGASESSTGYVQEADGGTLFLDEVADLDSLVQPKLLRLLEEREVMELGGTRPRKVDLRVCAATHKSLRAEVDAGRFREDLYFRIGKPEVRLPALAERPEEIPELLGFGVREVSPGMRMGRAFVEECLRRRWRGNVRELLLDARHAARAAVAAGRNVVEVVDLVQVAAPEMGDRLAPRAQWSEDEIVAILRALGGNVTGAARQLGWHRTQLRRWMQRRNLRASDVREAGEGAGPLPRGAAEHRYRACVERRADSAPPSA